MEGLAQVRLPFACVSTPEGEVASTCEADLLGAERKLKPEGVQTYLERIPASR